MKKKVCVIGAGLSGLCTIKELAEQGLDVVCYEAEESFGGAFNMGNESFSKAYSQMRLTVSNYFMAYSSFPPVKDEERRYWTATEYINYLDAYIRFFKLDQYIHYSH